VKQTGLEHEEPVCREQLVDEARMAFIAGATAYRLLLLKFASIANDAKELQDAMRPIHAELDHADARFLSIFSSGGVQ
jgi:hypothetical protein